MGPHADLHNPEGLDAVAQGVAPATAITQETLKPLETAEWRKLLELLRRISCLIPNEPFCYDPSQTQEEDIMPDKTLIV